LLCPRQRRLWNPSFSLRPRHKIPILPLRKKTLLRQPMTRKLRKRAVTISSPSRWIWIRRRRNCPGWKRSSRPKARSLLLRREWSQGGMCRREESLMTAVISFWEQGDYRLREAWSFRIWKKWSRKIRWTSLFPAREKSFRGKSPGQGRKTPEARLEQGETRMLPGTARIREDIFMRIFRKGRCPGELRCLILLISREIGRASWREIE